MIDRPEAVLFSIILVGMIVEGAFISRWLAGKGRSLLIVPLWLFLASGGFVLAALIGTTLTVPWFVSAALLLAGGLFHILCLRRVFQLFRKHIDPSL